MKIKSLSLKNFGTFDEISVNFDPNLTYLVGPNGSGKTTLGLSGIWATLQGVSERSADSFKGKRRLWVKYGGKSENRIVLVDDDGVEYIVERIIREDSQEISIKTASGEVLDKKWLDSFWDSNMLSPIAFSRLSPKDQAKYLGIDTSQFDTKIAELKEEATFLRREVKNFGEVEIPSEKAEPVDVSELNQEKNKAIEFNMEQDRLRRVYEEISGKIGNAQEQIAQKLLEIEKLRQSIKDLEMSAEQLPNPQSPIDTAGIDQKISEASTKNALAAAYQSALEKEEQKAAKELELSGNLEQQKRQVEEKTKYMQELDLPFSNLSIDDSGGLLMDGRPISPPHFSTGELIKVCTTLLSSKSPTWKYCFLEQFDLLDEQKAAEVLSWLSECGMQVVVEKVGDRMEGDNVIVLKDGKRN